MRRSDARPGPAHRRAPLGEGLLAACLALTVYLLTMPPSLTWAHWGTDGGDLIAAAAAGRFPHPPGFPAYTAIARLLLRPAWGDPARRLTLLSALSAAGAVGVVTAELRRTLPRPAALAVGLTLALAPLFWSQAIIVEVYTPAALGVALTLGRFPPHLLGLFWGITLSTHPVTLLLAPALIPRAIPPTGEAWPSLRRFLGGLALGLLPYLLMPLCGPWPQPWGDLRTPRGWWAMVTAQLYRGYLFALPLRDWPRRSLAWAALLARQFTPPGAALMLIGLRRRRQWGEALTLLLWSLYTIGYNTPDSLVYLVPLLPLLAHRMGEGLAWSLAQVGERWRWIAILLPLTLLTLHAGELSLRHDREAVAWLEATLTDLPRRAVVVTTQERHTFALWYAQEALHRRRDLLVVDRHLWNYPPYRAYLVARTGVAATRPEDFAQGRDLVIVRTNP